MSSASSSQPSAHHPTLYFHDGNIVLGATDTNGVLQRFRVHQTVLSSQSVTFAEMLSTPTNDGDSAGGLYDGVPFVFMQDAAKDLEDLLRVLYDPS